MGKTFHRRTLHGKVSGRVRTKRVDWRQLGKSFHTVSSVTQHPLSAQWENDGRSRHCSLFGHGIGIAAHVYLQCGKRAGEGNTRGRRGATGLIAERGKRAGPLERTRSRGEGNGPEMAPGG